MFWDQVIENDSESANILIRIIRIFLPRGEEVVDRRIRRFTMKKGLFLGLSTVDLLYVIEEFPEPDSKNQAETLQYHAGGPALNASVAFQFLGGMAIFCSSFGNT